MPLALQWQGAVSKTARCRRYCSKAPATDVRADPASLPSARYTRQAAFQNAAGCPPADSPAMISSHPSPARDPMHYVLIYDYTSDYMERRANSATRI